jgi:hypothetical protein
MRIVAMIVAVMLTSGCQTENIDETGPNTAAIERAEATSSQAAGVANTVAPTSPIPDGWVGEWRGVEGTMLSIAFTKTPGRYRLTMQYTLDDKGVFDGTATGDAIAFTRPDGPQVLRRGDGAATGLKWLADKKDCLVVKPGEGYCRD